MADDPVDIRNWQRRSDGITTSGKLDAHDPERLAAIGVRHVINLALDDHEEALTNECALLESAEIQYTHIPVPFDAPCREHVDALKSALAQVDGPTHVHCIMNYRVTAFLYIIDLERGVPESEARKRMTEIWNPFESDHPSVDAWRQLIS